MNATAAYDIVPITSDYTYPDGDRGLSVGCVNYDAYTLLPGAVRYRNEVYTKTGWNSDWCQAYYRTAGLYAVAIKE